MNSVRDVVRRGHCIGCGVCAYSDSIGKTVYSPSAAQNIPLLTAQNATDRTAFEVCPGKGYDIVAESARLYELSPYDLELGRVRGQYAAHSNDQDVLRNASSGGVMSHIAVFLLERNIVDRVLTTEFSYTAEPRTVCRLASSRSEVLGAQGSKYCPVDLSEAIRAIKKENYRVAVIGTPCQIAGIRNIQRHDPDFSAKVVLTIGNFCGGIKSYRNVSLLAERQGIDPTQIGFFRFRGNGQPGTMLIEDKSGQKAEMAYPQYVGLNGLSKHLRCHLCVDATGELADIACGDAWLPRFLADARPWSIVITRSKVADDLIGDMMRADALTLTSITADEIKLSQRENLRSKKTRQKSRRYLYSWLGFALPAFDGGYIDNQLDIWTEVKVFAKHKVKQVLEQLGLFKIGHRLTKGRSHIWAPAARRSAAR